MLSSLPQQIPFNAPFQPDIHPAIEATYPTILNIGCAEGYYAVGMARRMPDTRVLAFDINPQAQQLCAALAAKNGVVREVSTICSTPPWRRR